MSSHNTKKNEESQSVSGIVRVYKERGETLASLLVRFREEQGYDKEVKITYAGRLDPMAEGLVLFLVGESRFQKDALLGERKTYEVEVLLGVSTDTLDVLGMIEQETIVTVSEDAIAQAVEQMKSIREIPYPNYSSVPVEGVPLFVHARAGCSVSVPHKRITIYEAILETVRTVPLKEIAAESIKDISRVEGDFRQDAISECWKAYTDDTRAVQLVRLTITASSGTYMRSLAQWLGAQLGVPALAYSIKRTNLGKYSV